MSIPEWLTLAKKEKKLHRITAMTEIAILVFNSIDRDYRDYLNKRYGNAGPHIRKFIFDVACSFIQASGQNKCFSKHKQYQLLKDEEHIFMSLIKNSAQENNQNEDTNTRIKITTN